MRTTLCALGLFAALCLETIADDTQHHHNHHHHHHDHPAAEIVVTNTLPPGFRPDAAKTFHITARNFTFDVMPAPFTVQEGDSVTLVLTVADGAHGLNIQRYSDRATFSDETDNSVTMHFVADMAGEYGYFCTNFFCGSGHAQMFGIFKVEPATGIAIESFSPTEGPAEGGNTVAIVGSNFQNGARVFFGDTPALNVTFSDAQHIAAVAPPHTSGGVAIRVTNPDGTSATSAQSYNYAAARREITRVSPSSGTTAGGTAFEITGLGFQAGATVTIGGIAARNVEVVSSTLIRATTPLGPIDLTSSAARAVVVRNPDGTELIRENGFTWVLPSPTIASVSPASGPRTGGTRVTISGAGFSKTVGLVVSFGGVPAPSVEVRDAITLVVTTPPHSIGIVDVDISGGNGHAKATGAFTFQAATTRRRAARH